MRVPRVLAILAVATFGCGSPSPTPAETPLVPSAKAMPAVARLPLGWRWATPFPRGVVLHRVWGAGGSLVAVGDQGTILVSTDAGASWAARDSGTTADLLGVHGDAKGDTIFVSGAKGIVLRSRDRGATWAPTTSSPSDAELHAIWTDAAATNVVAVGSNGAITRSGDGGATWRDLGDSWHNPYLDITADDAGTIFAVGVNGRIARSTDGGASFTTTPFSNTHFYAVWADKDMTTAFASEGSVSRTTDHGVTWANVRVTSTSPRIHAAWGDGTGIAAVGEGGHLLRSLDHAHSFETVDLGSRSELVGLWGAPGVLVATSSDGAIRRSVDGGATWSLANALTTDRLDAAWIADDGSAWAGGGHEGTGVILRSFDHGVSWSVAPGDHLPVRSIWAANEDDVYAVEVNTLVRSLDRGRTWRPVMPKDNHVAVDNVWGDGHGGIFAAGGGGGPGLRSIDGGATWSRMAITDNPTVKVTGFFADDHGALWAAGSWGFLGRSTDRGATWSKFATPKPNATLSAIAGMGSSIVVTQHLGPVIVSTDGGATFVEKTLTPPENILGVRRVGKALHVYGERGTIWTSPDSGATWSGEAMPARPNVKMIAENTAGERIATGLSGGILVYGTRAPVAPVTTLASTAIAQGSPFATAAAALEARKALDARNAEALSHSFEPILARTLQYLVRPTGGEPKVAASYNGATLDMKLDDVKKSYRVGSFDCDATLGRFCPSRRFTSHLDPKAHADDVRSIKGEFVDGILYRLDVVGLDLPRPINEDHKRAYPEAFDLAVGRIMNGLRHPMNQTVKGHHPKNSPRAPEADIQYDEGRVVISMQNGTNGAVEIRVHLEGAVVGVVAANLDKQLEKENEAANAKAREQRKQELCTCKHLTVGQEWPPPSNGTRTNDPTSPRQTITALDPKTCTATLSTVAPGIGGASGASGGRLCSDMWEISRANQ